MSDAPQPDAPDARPRPATPTREQLAARRQYRRAVRRSRNPLYIPLSWLAAAALLVLIAVAGAIAAIVGLRQDSAAAPMEPIIVIATARTGSAGGDTPPAGGASASESGAQIILAAETPASLALTGPPVPTVILTNTPIPLSVGAQAIVHNVGNDELNVRNIPSINNSEVLFRAAAGTVFNVIGGPQAS